MGNVDGSAIFKHFAITRFNDEETYFVDVTLKHRDWIHGAGMLTHEMPS